MRLYESSANFQQLALVKFGTYHVVGKVINLKERKRKKKKDGEKGKERITREKETKIWYLVQFNESNQQRTPEDGTWNCFQIRIRYLQNQLSVTLSFDVLFVDNGKRQSEKDM